MIHRFPDVLVFGGGVCLLVFESENDQYAGEYFREGFIINGSDALN